MNKLFLLACLAGTLSAQKLGPQPDSTTLLPTGWRIDPAGDQIRTGSMPMSSLLSRDGQFLLVLNAGLEPPSISVISVADKKETARVPVPDAWLGLAFSPDQRLVYVGGGARNTVFEFTWSGSGELKYSRELGSRTNELAPSDFVGDVTVSSDGRRIYAADLFHDAVVVIDAASGRLLDRYHAARRPYRILLHPDGKSYFVTSWAEGSLVQYDSSNGSELSRLRLGPQTTDMVLSDRKLPVEDSDSQELSDVRYRIFVTASNTNNVFVVGVNASKVMRTIEVLNLGLSPAQPAGMTPSGLALNADQSRLYIACSDEHAVAVVDTTELRSRVAGFLPAGWYPTAARPLSEGRVAILNGRSNTVSIVSAPEDAVLGALTQTVLDLSAYLESDPDIPVAKPAPIENVVLILKEGRTYDQLLGKLGKGNGDPGLALVDESAAPNHFKLAREFTLFDNFYANSAYSVEGQLWAAAGIVPSFTARLWARRRAGPFEGGDPANLPPAGYLWSNARLAGLSVRNYGEFVQNLPQGARVTDPSLSGITNLNYRGMDLNTPDRDRARVFLEDLKQFESSGMMPRLTILRLANDRTQGSAAGRPTPQAMIADNDAALGQIVDAVSKTKFWPNTAIFVMETGTDAAPDPGKDHVNPHRSVLFAISPYTKRGAVDSTLYNTSSVLRTVELFLGLRPMTQFDAAARPMTAPFATAANPTPYTAEAPRVNLVDKNP